MFQVATTTRLPPDMKPPVRQKPSRGESSRYPAPLLPGLPDDLAIACLIRVPRAEHCKLRLVCKGWHLLVSGNFFYSLRKTSGVAEEWVYIIKKDGDGKISWHAFDPLKQIWPPLPPFPKLYSEAIGFGTAVLNGCHLYLFGGEHPVEGSMKCVIYYDPRTNKWQTAPDMLHSRQFFGASVINNCLYVAGGEKEGIHHFLKTVEFFDPNKNKWSVISDMNTAMLPIIGAVHQGKWYLKGLNPELKVVCEVYHPESDSWSSVYNRMVSGWRNPSASFNGKLYAMECRDGCKLRVYDEVSDSWNKHIDSGVHLGNSKAIDAKALVPVNGKLCIIRNNMRISLVDVSLVDVPRSKNVESAATSDSRRKPTLGRGQLKIMISKFWSSFAGRKRIQNHIVHCQVLEA